MSHTSTTTETYSVADVEIVMRRVMADLLMIASSTGAITEEKARDYGHDIELLAKNGYLKAVDITLLSNGVEQRATRFEVNTDTGDFTMSRPGGVLWPRVPGPHLRPVLFYTDAYTNDAKAKMSGKLRISWTPTSVDLTHAALKANAGRDYTSNGYVMQRKDFIR